jgi:hypothetical protein
MRPFAPRPIVHLGNETHAEWDVKRYSIVANGGSHDSRRFGEARAEAMRCLPRPARTAQRPGLAIAIEHQGQDADYFVLAWWDNENELPLRVFVRDRVGGMWRAARDGESVCVWDLQVLAAERDAYVTFMLCGERASRSDYLRTVART